MSARMDKTRKALGYGWAKLMTLEERDAALAEVEEWETRSQGWAADEESLGRLIARAEAAEAERDRLRRHLLALGEQV